MARAKKSNKSGSGAVSCIYSCGASFNTALAMSTHLASCPNRPKAPTPKYTKRPKDDE